MQILVTVEGDGIQKLVVAVGSLHNRTPDAARRALNHIGDKGRTLVKRALADQIQAPQYAIMKYGKVRAIRATYARLEYAIVSTGGPIPLKHFKPNQTAKGVSAAPWGRRRVYTHSFMHKNAMNGHVVWRVGKARLPIQRVAGPNVPKELVKDKSAAAFHTVAAELPGRVEHEIKVITDGIVS